MFDFYNNVKNIIAFLIFIFFINNCLAQKPSLVMPIGHLNNITGIELSKDGKYLLSVSKRTDDGTEIDNSAKLWKMGTGELLYTFKSETSIEARFSADNKYILTSGKTPNSYLIYSTEYSRVIDSISNPNVYMNSVDISDDGKYIATSSMDSMVRIWDAKSFDLLHTLPGFGKEISHLSFSPGSKFLTAISMDENRVITWSLPEFKKLYDKSFPEENETTLGMRNLIFSNNGEYFCTFGNGCYIRVWHTLSGSEKFLFEEIIETSGEVTKAKTHSQIAASFSHDNQYLITSNSRGYQASIWKISSGKLYDKVDEIDIPGLKDGEEILDVIFNPVNLAYLIFTSNGYIYSRTLGTYNGKLTPVYPNQIIYSFCNKFTKDGKILISTLNNSITALNNTNLKKEYDFKQNNSSLNSLAYNGTTNQFIASYSPGILAVTDLETPFNTRFLDSGFSEPFSILRYNPDNTYFIGFTPYLPTFAWQSDNLKKKYSIGKRGESRDMIISPGFNYMLKFSKGNFPTSVPLFNPKNGELAVTLDTNKNLTQIGINQAVFSNDEKKMITSNSYKIPVVWDLSTGEMSGALTGHLYEPNGIIFSKDNSKIITLSEGGLLRIYNSESPYQLIDTICRYKYSKTGYQSFLLTSDEQIFLFLEGKLVVLNMKDLRLIKIIQSVNVEYIKDIFITEDYKYFVFVNYSGVIKFYNTKDFSIEGSFTGSSFCYPRKGDFFLIQNDNFIDFYHKSNFKKSVSVAMIDNSNFILTPDGYYSASKQSTRQLHYVEGLQVITFEQLDVKYNRPDKVLEAIGCDDTALISSYRKAYFKRIKKLGIDTASFRGGYSVPESDFENREAIEPEQKSEKLSLHIKGVDSTYKLDRFNIWINEIPLFGQKGFNIKKRNKNDLDTTITIRLSQGVNRIETSILNVNGTESYRMPLQVNYSPEIKSKEKLHFVGIGIDKFADSIYNLQYSVKDIRDLSKKLKEKFGDRVSIDTLFNENVTIANVKEVKEKLLKTSINDKVIISYSGHGLLSKEYDYYLSTYSVNFDKPQENGLPYDELENLLDSIPARKKLMLIDACHSGEVDKDEEFAMNNTADSMGLSKPKGGRTINSKSIQQLGLKNSFELMQSLFVNVGKSTGANIISAAAGNQFALEKGNLKNGVFTYCILEAMNTNSTMTVSQLKSTVGKRVEELTNGLQKPTSRNETINSDWSVW